MPSRRQVAFWSAAFTCASVLTLPVRAFAVDALMVAPPSARARLIAELASVAVRAQVLQAGAQTPLRALRKTAAERNCQVLVFVPDDVGYAAVWAVTRGGHLTQRSLMRGHDERPAALALRVAELVAAWRDTLRHDAKAKARSAPAETAAISVPVVGSKSSRARRGTPAPKRPRTPAPVPVLKAVKPSAAKPTPATPTAARPTAARPTAVKSAAKKPQPDKPTAALAQRLPPAGKAGRLGDVVIGVGVAVEGGDDLSKGVFGRIHAAWHLNPTSAWGVVGAVELPLQGREMSTTAGTGLASIYVATIGGRWVRRAAGLPLSSALEAGFGTAWTSAAGIGNDWHTGLEADLLSVAVFAAGTVAWHFNSRWAARAGVRVIGLNPTPVFVLGDRSARRTGFGLLRTSVSVEARL